MPSLAMQSLALGVIGNGSFNALIDERARVVWCCLPRPDGDPVLNALLGGDASATRGVFAVELDDVARSRQSYKPNTAILETELTDRQGNAISITDFAPRFMDRGRLFRPLLLARRIAPIAGRPRIRVTLTPTFNYGATEPELTRGSNHVRYVHATQALRLTTDMPLTYVLERTPHMLDGPVNLVFGVDETLGSGIAETLRDYEQRTTDYWRLWARALAVPLDWQDAVIRAAITLKLCAYEETGAILAAMTTSIPEAPGTQRTWDYRYCWLRDAFFVIRALNSLSEMATMEDYLRYLFNVVHTASANGHLQPVYGIGLDHELTERTIDSLPGYRGIGPVRVGNEAWEHRQHDAYGHTVLAATQAFFDRRLLRPATHDDFTELEWVGEQAFKLYAQPDAGIWELRTLHQVHTSSAVMCWAACDRLAKIASALQSPKHARSWRTRAERLRKAILEHAWNARRKAFVGVFGGEALDASVLLMGEVDMIAPDDPRWRQTLTAIKRELKQGHHLFRYRVRDDFGLPTMAFTACTFWYIDALARIGERDEACGLFDDLLASRNPLGILSEDIDPASGELWGNFPQTYSMVGIINGATRLSRRWDSVL
jgi:GH15 family glucan-1,4-alpha-glucosidase